MTPFTEEKQTKTHGSVVNVNSNIKSLSTLVCGCFICSLLNLDVDVWVHLNCALWSLEVYETLNGALMNVDVAVKRGTVTVG